jgi:hypothetical protein
MGPHGSYNVDFELAKVRQHQLRGERTEDRLARAAGDPATPRPAGSAAPAHALVHALRLLALRCMPLRKSIAPAE